MGVRLKYINLDLLVSAFLGLTDLLFSFNQEVDFEGQKLAERLYTWIITVAGVRHSYLASLFWSSLKQSRC